MQSIAPSHLELGERIEIVADDVFVCHADAAVNPRRLLTSEKLTFAKLEFGLAASLFIISYSNVQPIKKLSREAPAN